MSGKSIVFLVVVMIAVAGVLCVGGCGGLFYWIFKETGAASSAADEFLAKLGNGDVAGAYRSGSSGLRSAQSENEFAAAAHRMGLTDYSGSSWKSRRIVNNGATLDGTISTRSGSTIPITVELESEDGNWKVRSINSSGPGSGAKLSIPSDAENKKLVEATLRDFLRGVRNNDFSDLHRHSSYAFKADNSPESLKTTFAKFATLQARLAELEGAAHALTTPPALDEKQWLVLIGEVRKPGGRLQFTLKYTYEHPSWKLVSINVKFEPL